VLTSASVHDSQVAIPLMTMTSARVSYLYDLMDAAYDAAAIHDQSRTLGHAPIVDRNFRADHQAKAEWGREVERLKLIHMPDFDDLIYDFRTMAERVNARLKDEFGARFLRVRGALKVKCHLMFGIVALAVDQIIRVVNYRTAPGVKQSGAIRRRDFVSFGGCSGLLRGRRFGRGFSNRRPSRRLFGLSAKRAWIPRARRATRRRAA